MRIILTIDGVDQVIERLTAIGEKAEQNLETLTKELAKDTQTAWQQATPKGKTGRLQEGDKVVPEGLLFTLQNPVFYYKFVNDGHNTPAGWRTKHGYRRAKRRSHVAGRDMTQKALEFVEQNIDSYLSKFLDNA